MSCGNNFYGTGKKILKEEEDVIILILRLDRLGFDATYHVDYDGKFHLVIRSKSNMRKMRKWLWRARNSIGWKGGDVY